jgi:hypothetical protein
MAESVVNNFFPSQVASDQEKMSFEYGRQVGRAIQSEWFGRQFRKRKISKQSK